MKSEIMTFADERFDVRTMDIEGRRWMAAVDLCRVLGIVKTHQAVSRLDDDEKLTVVLTGSHSGKRGGARSLIFVTESGLYSLIMMSRKPEAKRFKRWVTQEVLPAIRKNGWHPDSPGSRSGVTEESFADLFNDIAGVASRAARERAQAKVREEESRRERAQQTSAEGKPSPFDDWTDEGWEMPEE